MSTNSYRICYYDALSSILTNKLTNLLTDCVMFTKLSVVRLNISSLLL